MSKPILFADDTSIAVTNSDPLKFKQDIKVFMKINNWFESN